jgi:membrane protease YdiL (CAAX protease family)
VNDWAHQLYWITLAYAAVSALVIIAIATLIGFMPGARRWLPLPRLRPTMWTGYDVFLTFCVLFGFANLIVSILFALGFFTIVLGPAPDQEAAREAFQEYLNRATNIASPLVLAVTLGVLFAFLFARSGTRPHHYGLSWARWPANFKLGLVAFLIVTPLVYAIYVLATFVFPQSKHHLELLGKQNIELWEWALLAFQAAIAAPLLEEIVFRGILLGWLRRAALRGHLIICSMTIFVTLVLLTGNASEKTDWRSYAGPLLFAGCLVALYVYLMVRLVRRFGLNEEEIRAWNLTPIMSVPTESLLEPDEAALAAREQMRQDEERRLRIWAEANADLSILGTAILFAMVHTQNWPAPVPLAILGLALGWLARRTQSLIAPITLHALFNLVAFLALYATAAAAPPANGNAQTTPTRPSLVGSITTSVPASQLPLRK